MIVMLTKMMNDDADANTYSKWFTGQLSSHLKNIETGKRFISIVHCWQSQHNDYHHHHHYFQSSSTHVKNIKKLEYYFLYLNLRCTKGASEGKSVKREQHSCDRGHAKVVKMMMTIFVKMAMMMVIWQRTMMMIMKMMTVIIVKMVMMMMVMWQKTCQGGEDDDGCDDDDDD